MSALPARTVQCSLAELLRPWAWVPPGQNVAISQLTLSSREVMPGSLFAALAGTRGHGLHYVEQALTRGAAAVIWEPADGIDAAPAARLCAARHVPLVAIDQLADKLSAIAGRFYGGPSRALRVVGVTGTDGKTSVSQFLAGALDRAGARCGVLGTLGYGFRGALAEATHTTPDAVRVQALLAELRDAGAAFAAMEVSSHALVQGRVAGLDFEVAVLTNLTRDHLDYHGSETAYAEAKARLFHMPGLGNAVLNHDDAFGRRLAEALAGDVRVWRYSLDPAAAVEVVCHRVHCHADGLDLQFTTPFGGVEVRAPLFGRFNAANVAAVLSTLLALGFDRETAAARLRDLEPVPGRMERFGGGGLPTVIVDYAHTPAALNAALDAARAHSRGRVWCVFGCGGDRDAGKRPQMGGVADAKADHLVITDDNPRTEDPDQIVRDILAGVAAHAPRVVRDRAEAIRFAVRHADRADTVLIAGKGHETYQLVGTAKLPFDDREAVRTALQERT